MHFLFLSVILYLFGACIFLLWEHNPVITIIAVTIAAGLAIVEGSGQ
jgi:hypothetical protein